MGDIRAQYVHAIDMLPTVLEVLGIEALEQICGVAQSPIEGISFAHTFNKADALSNHHTQYFEMFATWAVDSYTFYPNLSVVDPQVAPLVFGRPHTITAEVEIPAGGAEGVLVAQGGVSGGCVSYVKEEKLHYIHTQVRCRVSRPNLRSHKS